MTKGEIREDSGGKEYMSCRRRRTHTFFIHTHLVSTNINPHEHIIRVLGFYEHKNVSERR
jgi:hypothetical protein